MGKQRKYKLTITTPNNPGWADAPGTLREMRLLISYDLHYNRGLDKRTAQTKCMIGPGYTLVQGDTSYLIEEVTP